MAIPKWIEMTLPILQYLKDKSAYSRTELTGFLCDHFKLSEKERKQLLPSGREPTVNNRTRWAIMDLRKAGLIETLPDKTHRITTNGLKVLEKNPKIINRRFLMAIPEFRKYINKQENDGDAATSTTMDYDATPEDLVNMGYKKYRLELESQLLDMVKCQQPSFFEQLVVDLMEKMGYGIGTVTGKSGDGGIDGVVDGDRLGLDRILLQAKRYQGNVPGPDVHNFVGALAAHKTNKGIFLTTSDFSENTRKYVEKIPDTIILINGKRLAELMYDYDVGFSKKGKPVDLKEIDEDYFPSVSVRAKT